MAQLVEILCFKAEGRGFDYECCHLKFSLTLSFRPHYVPGVTQPVPETGSVQSCNAVALPFLITATRQDSFRGSQTLFTKKRDVDIFNNILVMKIQIFCDVTHCRL